MADESNQPEQTYDEARARNLEALLRALAGRILELDAQGSLLKQAGELMRLIGDVKSELFHYEVRATYDTPDVAESRRIVRDAQETNTDKSKWDSRSGEAHAIKGQAARASETHEEFDTHFLSRARRRRSRWHRGVELDDASSC